MKDTKKDSTYLYIYVQKSEAKWNLVLFIYFSI